MKRQKHLNIENQIILNRIINDQAKDEQDSGTYRANRLKWDEQNEALEKKTSERKFNTKGTETNSSGDILISRVLSIIQKPVSFMPTEKNDAEKAEKNEEFYRYYVNDYLDGFHNFIVEYITTIKDYGFGIAQINWERRETKDIDIRPYPVEIMIDEQGQEQLVSQETGEYITQETIVREIFSSDKYRIQEPTGKIKEIGEDRLEIIYEQHIDNPTDPNKQWDIKVCIIDFSVDESNGILIAKVEMPQVEYDGVVIDNLNYDRVFHPADAKDLQRCDHVIVEFETTISELIAGNEKGEYHISPEDMDIIKKNTDHQKKYTYSSVEQKEKTVEGTEESMHPENYKPVTCLTGYYLFDVEGNGKLEQCIFTIVSKCRVVIEKRYLSDKYRHGKRPITCGKWLPRKYRLFGIGLPEKMRSLQLLIDDLRNQILETAAYMANPPGWYDPVGGTNEKITTKIGQYLPYPGGSGNPPVTIPINADLRALFEMLKHYMEQFQKQSMVSEPLQGQQGGLKTATAFMKALSENYQNLSIIFKNVLDAIKQVHKMIWMNIVAYMPDDMEYRTKGSTEVQTFSRRDIIKNPDINIDVTAEELSKEYMQTAITEVFMNLANNPLMIQAGIVQPRNMYEMAKDYAESFSKGAKDYLTEPPQPEPPHDPEEENYLMVQGEEVVPSPLDDDAQHIQIHQVFPVNNAQQIQPEVFAQVVMRIQAHNNLHIQAQQAKLQQQLMMAQMAGQQGGKGAGQGGQSQNQGGPAMVSPQGNMTGLNMQMPGMGEIG